jgi:hypothetical protein
MAVSTSERIYKISVDGAAAIRQLEKISGSAASIDSRFARFGRTIGTALGALAAAGALGIAVRGLNRASQAIDELGKTAQKFSVSVDSLSAFNFAAAQSGASAEKLNIGLKKLSVAMAELNQPTKETSVLLTQIGITAGDTTEKAFVKLAEAISKMPDGVEKTNLAVKLLGKSGTDLIPMLNEGAEGLDKFRKRAEELGLVIKDTTVAQLTAYNDNMAEIGRLTEGATNKILEGLAPALATLSGAIAQTTGVSDGFVLVGEKIGAGLIGLSRLAIKTAAGLDLLYESIVSFKSLEDLNAFFNGIGEGSAFDIKQSALDRLDAIDRLLAATANLTNKTNELGEANNRTFGARKKGPLEQWAEGLVKAGEQSDLVTEKLVYLTLAMESLAEQGKSSTGLFKVIEKEYTKLSESLAEGDVGLIIGLQVGKIKKEAQLTAEKIEYLGRAIAAAFEDGAIENAMIMIKLLEDLKDTADDTADQFTQMGESISDAIANNANNAVNSFIDNIGEAQMSFSDFATSVVKDIAKMVVQMLIMKPIMESIRGFFGGFSFSGPGVMYEVNAKGNSFAGGTGLAHGVYNQPTFFEFAKGGTFGRTGVLGEAGPEAIMPLRRTASGDLGVQGSPVYVNVYNTAGVEVETRSSTSADGTKQIDVYIEKKVREGIAGGSFDRVMRSTYGLSRAGA